MAGFAAKASTMTKAPDAAQVIAQAAKNLRDTGPVRPDRPKQDRDRMKAPRADKSGSDNSSIVQQYRKMEGSAMW